MVCNAEIMSSKQFTQLITGQGHRSLTSAKHHRLSVVWLRALLNFVRKTTSNTVVRSLKTIGMTDVSINLNSMENHGF